MLDGSRRQTTAIVAGAAIAAIGLAVTIIAVFSRDEVSRRPPPTTAAGRACPLNRGSMSAPDYFARADVSDLPTLDVPWVERAVELDRGPSYGVRKGELRPVVSNQGPTGVGGSGIDHLGIPINDVDSSTPRLEFRKNVNPLSPEFLTGRVGSIMAYASISDEGTYPDPTHLMFQGWPGPPTWDGYVFSVDRDSCLLYEQTNVRGLLPYDTASQRFYPPIMADAAVIWDLRDPSPDHGGGTRGVGGSQVPISPLVVRFAEVERAASGGAPIDHALHWFGVACRGGNRVLGEAFVWPARFTDCGATVDEKSPPYGAWFRLRSDYPVDDLPPQARAVVKAMQTHGLILGDGGSQGYYMEPAPCPKLDDDPEQCWTSDSIAALEKIDVADLEAVDTSSLRADPKAGISDADYWHIRQ